MGLGACGVDRDVTHRRIPLSVLDLAPVPEGSGAAEALRRSTDLVRLAERLGYHRHWVAEHHNMPGIASSAPPVVIAHLAAASTTIRVGSGGVMLPNHAPLVVAEQFGTLEALHPGRIDLGIGRAPGTDRATAAALRRGAGLEAEDFLEQLGQLIAFFDGSYPEHHPLARVHAVPGEGSRPEVWLLGSSGYSAQVAAHLGLPFAFAHHFMPENTLAAVELYRSLFRPSERLAAPRLMLGIAAVLAGDEKRARFLHGSMRLSMMRLRSGRPGKLPSPEEASRYAWSPEEEAVALRATSSHVVGDPATAGDQLAALLAETGADELAVTTNVFDHDERLHSYELLAGLPIFEPSGETASALG